MKVYSKPEPYEADQGTDGRWALKTPAGAEVIVEDAVFQRVYVAADSREGMMWAEVERLQRINAELRARLKALPEDGKLWHHAGSVELAGQRLLQDGRQALAKGCEEAGALLRSMISTAGTTGQETVATPRDGGAKEAQTKSERQENRHADQKARAIQALYSAPGSAGPGETLTEDRLREIARDLHWYVREGTSVPKLDGGWRHPFTVTADSRDLCDLVNRLATPSPAQEPGTVDTGEPPLDRHGEIGPSGQTRLDGYMNQWCTLPEWDRRFTAPAQPAKPEVNQKPRNPMIVAGQARAKQCRSELCSNGCMNWHAPFACWVKHDEETGLPRATPATTAETRDPAEGA